MSVGADSSSCARRASAWGGVLVVVVSSAVFAAMAFEPARSALTVMVMVCGFLTALVVLPRSVYRGMILPLARGVQCPRCREWGLVRVAAFSFGDRYDLCEFCGQRCKRADPDSPWLDASSPRDADVYTPTHEFSPERRREVSRRVRWVFTTLAVCGLLLAVAALTRGWIAEVAIPAVFLAVYLFARLSGAAETAPRDEKEVVPNHPGLWDREVDV
jgi:hypothetical protein